MKHPRASRGHLFRRTSRHTGELLPTWWLRYRVDGREVRESSGTTDEDEAKRLLNKRISQADDGTLPDPDLARLTVGDVLRVLLRHYEKKKHRSIATARSQMKATRAAIGRVLARALTTDRLDHHYDAWLADGASTATCNRRVQLLEAAWHRAKVPIPPQLDFREVMRSEEPPQRDLLGVAAFEAILAQLPPYLRPYFEFAYLTGVRKAQLAKTTWQHYDASTGTFTWSKAEVKSKYPHVLVLDGRPLDIITQLYESRRLFCRHVFHGRFCGPGRIPSQAFGCTGDIKKSWTKACRAAGYPNAQFHDTRRAAVTNLAQAGVPAHEIMDISGHRTRSMLDRYSIGTAEQKRRAFRRQTEYLAGEREKATPKVQPIR